MTIWHTEWSFQTATLEVRLQSTPCDDDPAGCFDDAADIEAVRDGSVSWFDSRVQVLHRPTGAVLGENYLGCSAYVAAVDFWTAHRDPDPDNRNCSLRPDRVICHYFPDMVSQACQEARVALNKLAATPVRGAAA